MEWIYSIINHKINVYKLHMEWAYEKDIMFRTLGAGGISINNELEKKVIRLRASKLDGTSIADSLTVSSNWSLFICKNQQAHKMKKKNTETEQCRHRKSGKNEVENKHIIFILLNNNIYYSETYFLYPSVNICFNRKLKFTKERILLIKGCKPFIFPIRPTMAWI